MSATSKPTVFISAATVDLEEWRHLICDLFDNAGFKVIEQNRNLPPARGTLSQLLEEQITANDCVIHLAGLGYGWHAEHAFPEHPDFQCSWTQFEYYYAHQQGKDVIALVCAPNLSKEKFQEEGNEAEQKEKQALQLAHRDRVASGQFDNTPLAGKCEQTLNSQVSDRATLYKKLAAAIGDLNRTDPAYNRVQEELLLIIERLDDLKKGQKQISKKQEEAERERRKFHRRLVVLGTLGLLLLGGSFWWGVQHLSKGTSEIGDMFKEDQTRLLTIASNGRQRIEADYKANLKVINSDSLLAQDLAARRTAKDAAALDREILLASLDRFIADLRQAYRQNETSSELDEFQNIAASQGFAQAVSYYEDVSSRNNKQIESLLSQRDHLDVDLRSNLRFTLTAANAAVTANEWNQATSLYEELLSYAPNWPDALLAYSNFLLYSQGPRQETHGTIASLQPIYDQAFTFTQRAHNLKPKDPAYQHALSVSLHKLGEIQLRLGDADQALKHYQQSFDLRESLAQSHPHNSQYQRDLSISFEQLGDLQSLKGDSDAALSFFEQARDIRERLADDKPDNLQLKSDLSNSLERIGDFQLMRGQEEEALKFFQQTRTIREKTTQLDPRNSQFKRDLSTIFNKIGDLKLRLEDEKEALKFFQLARDARKDLVDLDSQNLQFERDLSVSLTKIGELQLHLKNNDEALKLFMEARSIALRLSNLDPKDTQSQRDLSISCERLGQLQIQLDDRQKALSYLQQAYDTRQKLADIDPNDTQSQRDLSVSCNMLGDLQSKLGNAEQALELFERDLLIAQKLVQLAPDNAGFQRDLFVSHYKFAFFYQTGDAADSEKALEHLQKSHAKLIEMKEKDIILSSDESRIEKIAAAIRSMEAQRLEKSE